MYRLALILASLVAAPAGAPPDTAAPALRAAEWQDPLLSVRPLPDDGHRPILRIGPLLADEALSNAVRGGLPLRIRIRVELWQDQLLDDLEANQSIVLVVRYEPLEKRFIVHEHLDRPVTRSFDSYAAARTVVERAYALDIRPRGRGRYYYLAKAEVETLSLSDLQELENWLRGELKPAVRGRTSVFSAIGEGAKRLFIRVLGLPAREVSTRSNGFSVR